MAGNYQLHPRIDKYKKIDLSENIKPILDFLKRTGIGCSKEPRTKVGGKEIEREEEEEEFDIAIEAARGNKIGEDKTEDIRGFAFEAFEW
jgi:hypothetical protein